MCRFTICLLTTRAERDSSSVCKQHQSLTLCFIMSPARAACPKCLYTDHLKSGVGSNHELAINLIPEKSVCVVDPLQCNQHFKSGAV